LKYCYCFVPFCYVLIKIDTEDVTRKSVGICNLAEGVALEGILHVGTYIKFSRIQALSIFRPNSCID
jgi:hypothetical protein